jgi:hypothetical protein
MRFFEIFSAGRSNPFRARGDWGMLCVVHAWKVSAWAACLLATLAGQAAAQQSGRIKARLEWDVPTGAGCTPGEELAARAERILGRDVFTQQNAHAVVRGGVERVDGQWHAELHLQSPEGVSLGRREVRRAAARCDALDSALAVVLALVVDVPVSRVESASTPEQQPGTTLELPEEQTTRESGRAPSAVESGWSVGGEVAAVGSYNMLPGFAAAIRSTLVLDAPRMWPIRLSMARWFERSTRVEGARAELSLFSGRVGVCPTLLRDKPFRIEACGVVAAGRLTGQGDEVAQPRTRKRPWVHVEARATFAVPIGGPFEVTLDLGALVPVLRDRFLLEIGGTEQQAHRAWPVVPVASLGLAARISS